MGFAEEASALMPMRKALGIKEWVELRLFTRPISGSSYKVLIQSPW